MGMAASQARLLTITARLADNELRSQTINNAKMRLAAQSSQASETYINALNNATFKFSNYDLNGNAMSQDLTYNALTAYSSYNTQYGLINSANQILVSEGEAAKFIQANGNLNTYLKSHGLEFKTTYFEELGAIQNEAYPEPFNIISVERLEQYHREYGSYENSMEVQNYQNNYSEYIEATNKLQKGCEDVLLKYLQYDQDNVNDINDSNLFTSIITDDEGNGGVSFNNAVNTFKGMFTTGNNNYNLKDLLNMKLSDGSANPIISKAVYDILMEEVNAYRQDGATVIYSEAIDFEKGTTDADGNTTYYLDDGLEIVVGSDGNVKSFDDSEMAAESESDEDDIDNFETNYPKNADGTLKAMPLVDFIKNLSYKLTDKDDDGITLSSTFYYSPLTDASGEVIGATADTHYASADIKELRKQMQSSATQILQGIVNYANYENFAEMLLDMYNRDKDSIKFFNMDDEIPAVGKSLTALLEEFQGSKDSFLNTIFDAASIPTVEQDLELGNFALEDGRVVTLANLTDIDFVLQYLEARGLTQSNSFNTVIKEFLLSEIIATYGEPKYAWVDENDTANTGNADAKAQWYTNLFNRMNQGFKILENGLASSKEWMEYALESGIVTLEQVDKSFRWNGIDYRTCTRITEETDDSAVTKAEAEYNRAMKDIEAKDNIYDLELKNIDTEHTALQTEYDVIKGVIDKNIARTFKFNQSA